MTVGYGGEGGGFSKTNRWPIEKPCFVFFSPGINEPWEDDLQTPAQEEAVGNQLQQRLGVPGKSLQRTYNNYLKVLSSEMDPAEIRLIR